MKNHHHLGRMHMALAALLVTLVAACGGGSVLPNIERIVVVGDSLSDVGTFNGMKFTVQNGNDEEAGYPIWTQLTETAYGLDGNAQCNHYVWDETSLVPTFSEITDASCTNYAIGGAQISAPDTFASEFNIGTQLTDHASASGFNANDLLLIDGGGNDLAELAELYLSATDAAGQSTFDTYVGRLLGANPNSDRAAAGREYMAALASKYYQIINDTALQNGAQQVLVLNVPDITLTPRFLAVLDGIEQSSGHDAATATKDVIRGWAQAFNSALANLAANESRVVIADFFTLFDSQIANASKYGLTNVSEAACPAGPDSLLGDLPTCTDTALDQLGAPGWWKTYAFSDNFHPTPRGHELLAAFVNQTLKGAGWL
jgi:outer membrane lipase/esterase